MWFLFGVITFISVCCYQAHKRLNAAWQGKEATDGAIRYQYKFETNKGKITGLLIGIAGPDTLDFTLKREKTLDRFFKYVGIAREHQTGNQTFDDLAYPSYLKILFQSYHSGFSTRRMSEGMSATFQTHATQ